MNGWFALALAVVTIPQLALAVTWLVVLVRGWQDANRNTRVAVMARVMELFLFALLIWLAALTRSWWTLLAFLAVVATTATLRRTLRRRELAL
jgi:hypothetical protein